MRGISLLINMAGIRSRANGWFKKNLPLRDVPHSPFLYGYRQASELLR